MLKNVFFLFFAVSAMLRYINETKIFNRKQQIN